jgi:hypothetical protein
VVADTHDSVQLFAIKLLAIFLERPAWRKVRAAVYPNQVLCDLSRRPKSLSLVIADILPIFVTRRDVWVG